MNPRTARSIGPWLFLLLVAGCGAENAEKAGKRETKLEAREDWGPRAWSDATESLRKGHDWSYHYVSVEPTCPLCAKKFFAAELGSYSTRGSDLDLKANGLSANPYLFALWMCPNCGYCAFATDFPHPEDPERIRRAVSGSRTWASYFDIPYSALLRAAEVCYRSRSYTEWKWAWFDLYGAWVARDSERPVEEREYHEAARTRFETLARTASGEKRAQAEYLVGEIHRRYGRVDEARAWLDRAEASAKDTKARGMQSWIDACRKELRSGEPPASPVSTPTPTHR